MEFLRDALKLDGCFYQWYREIREKKKNDERIG